jgi:hypothetical protein
MLQNVIFIVLLCLVITTNSAVICPNLRSAANFTVVAGSAVTNTGFTVINGNLAISPSISLTGFNSSGVIYGSSELGTGVALQVQKDVISAYNDFKGASFTTLMTGVDLTGKTLGSGVYKFDSTAGISTPAGILTLNGTGIYIFQVGSALTTSTNSEIRLINGAKPGCIFWQVGSSATLGQYSIFVGNILASASVGLGTNVAYTGSVYAQALISFISDTVTGQSSCDLCEIIPDSVLGRVSRNLPQNILLYISTMLIVILFRK